MNIVFLLFFLTASFLQAGTMTFDGGGVGTATFAGDGTGSADTDFFNCVPDGDLGTQTRNSATSFGANQFAYSNFTTGLGSSSSGTITHCWARINNVSTGVGISIGVYDTSGNILAYTNFNSSGGTEAWQGGELNTPVCLDNATEYYVGMVTSDAAWNLFFDTTEFGVDISSISYTYSATLESTSFASPSLLLENQGGMFWCDDTGVTPT